MKPKALPLLLSALTMLATTTAALADSAPTAVGQTPKSVSPFPTKVEIDYKRAHQLLTRTASTPVKTAGLLSALAIGPVISVARREVIRNDQYLNALNTEYKHDGLTPLMLVSGPGHILRQVGTVGEGILFAGFEAAEHWDKPFSPAAFSMEDLSHIDLSRLAF